MNSHENPVVKWFGDEFEHLSPLIQKLHREGGCLNGRVDVKYGQGLARVIGLRLARKMGIPQEGEHAFSVAISHSEQGLHWDRTFNDTAEVKSIFKPIGTKRDGYWLEETGDIKLFLTVEIIENAWVWKPLAYRIKGLAIPKWLFPKLTAFKRAEEDSYFFYVGFSLPVLGGLLSYSGSLNAE